MVCGEVIMFPEQEYLLVYKSSPYDCTPPLGPANGINSAAIIWIGPRAQGLVRGCWRIKISDEYL